ncbi:MerR family transcriptional regulator [Dactylosporangium sp. AC04546]|nr:MerR family transcriptional regulator [Dactylosporangium sp. AC04546]WVK89713.1 MerR family transcriptional regulator [Dactylosporangium sp. AC04546]
MRAGEFGAAAQLSPKALRLYAEQGLLLPAAVDPATGYRSYSVDQLPRARVIARLRRLGLPLARIGFLADLTPEARALELRGWLHAQRRLLDERAAGVEAVQGEGADAGLVSLVGLREVPATKVLCRSARITSGELSDLIQGGDRDIRAHQRASGLPGDGRRIVTFFELVTPDSEGLVEVAVAYAGSLEPVGDLCIRLAAAHTEAYLPVPASHEDLPRILRVYDAVEAWTDANGVLCTGAPCEVTPGTGGASFDVAYPV